MDAPVLINTLSIKRLGFALGATAALLYVGCVFVMLTVPRPTVVASFRRLDARLGRGADHAVGHALVGGGLSAWSRCSSSAG